MTIVWIVLSLLVGAAIGTCVTVLLARRSAVQLAESSAGPLVGSSVPLAGTSAGPLAPRSGPAVRYPDTADGAARNAALATRVLGAVDVGIVVVDRDEIAVFANPAARAMRVVDHDRVVQPALKDLVRTVTDSGRPGSVTVDLAPIRGGPETRSYLVRAMPLNEDDRVAIVVLRFSDVTESRRLERVRHDFVANVSHELKTPVGALTLLAEAVQNASDDPDAVQRFSHRMQREGARLGRLVQELIELSRLQGGEALPGEDLVDVGDVVAEAVDRSRLVAEQSGITVVDRVEPGLYVRGNETQLATALANLVDNAIAYSPQRTRVGLTARMIVQDDGSEWVEISVTDQGIGITEVDLDRVFERFYRVDQARSRATGGTGLGLAIVKHVATNHGGGVSVWSVFGSGSTFTLRLPLAERGASAAVRIVPPLGKRLESALRMPPIERNRP